MLRKSVALATFAVLVLLPATTFAAAAKKHRTSKVTGTQSKSKRIATKKPIGPRGIEDERATEIQAALIKAGYLTGEPSGHWDSESQAAMVKLQADNGWQTKLVPDSRALIKIGLGPADSTRSATSVTTGAQNSLPGSLTASPSQTTP